MNENSFYWRGHLYFPDWYEQHIDEYITALDNRWEELKEYTDKIDFSRLIRKTPPNEVKETILGSCSDCKGSLTTYTKSEDIEVKWLDPMTIGDGNVEEGGVTAENIGNYKGKPNFKIEYAYGFCNHCKKTKWSWATIYNRYRTASYTKDIKSV